MKPEHRSTCRQTKPWTVCCAFGKVASFLVLTVLADARAEPNRQELLAGNPLAECSLQELPSQESRPQMQPGVIQPNTALTLDPLSYYARQIDGQWYIPQTVDRGDPWIRLLLLGPRKPVLVDIAVLVDSQPYRSAREEWIDVLLAKAKQESLIDGALAASGSESSEQLTSEDESAEDLSEDDSDVAVVEAKSRRAPGVVKRLVNYLATGGAEEDREEIRWLIAEWGGGPALLSLGPALSWQRAKVAPLWNRLDKNSDRVLSADEISQSSDRLWQSDVNEDEIVNLEEIQRSTTSLSPYSNSLTHPLIVVLDEVSDWNQLRKTLEDLYGEHRNQDWASESIVASQLFNRTRDDDLSRLLYVHPDLTFRANINSEDGKVSLLSSIETEEGSVSSSSDVISVDLGGTYLEFSATAGRTNSKLDLRQTQIAIGAIVDGYPLFRLTDRDNNRQLTARELSQIEQILLDCDLNHDGKLEPHEIPTAIRLAVTHGAHAHEVIRSPTGAVHRTNAREKSALPPWFAQMDQNRDGDLSRNEFLGTSEQFQRLDRNRDGLISEKEAQDRKNTGE